MSRDTVLKRLRFWVQAGVLGEIMNLLVLRGALGGAIDLLRVSIDIRSIRAESGGRTLAPTRQTGASPG